MESNAVAFIFRFLFSSHTSEQPFNAAPISVLHPNVQRFPKVHSGCKKPGGAFTEISQVDVN